MEEDFSIESVQWLRAIIYYYESKYDNSQYMEPYKLLDPYFSECITGLILRLETPKLTSYDDGYVLFEDKVRLFYALARKIATGLDAEEPEDQSPEYIITYYRYLSNEMSAQKQEVDKDVIDLFDSLTDLVANHLYFHTALNDKGWYSLVARLAGKYTDEESKDYVQGIEFEGGHLGSRTWSIQKPVETYNPHRFNVARNDPHRFRVARSESNERPDASKIVGLLKNGDKERAIKMFLESPMDKELDSDLPESGPMGPEMLARTIVRAVPTSMIPESRSTPTLQDAIVEGLAMGAADTAGDILLAMSRKMAKDSPAALALLEDQFGQDLAKFGMATLVRTLALSAPSLVPKSEFISRACDLQIKFAAGNLTSNGLSSLGSELSALAGMFGEPTSVASLEASTATPEEVTSEASEESVKVPVSA